MFLILIILAAVLLFVLFAKRPVNTTGLHASWKAPVQAAPPSSASAPNAQPTAPPPDVTTVDFNDIFRAKPSDRPHA